MLSLKDRISSPLEAGTSILDARHLPPHMTTALDYASKRLARKGLHITLVVARRDYQLPDACASSPMPSPGVLSPPATPAPVSAVSTPRSAFAPVAAIKQLVRSGTHPNLASLESRSDIKPLQRSKTVSPIFSPASSTSSIDTSSPRVRWPLSPMSAASTPRTPRTPATPATSVTASSTTGTDASCGLPAPAVFGIKLLHASPLNPRMEKVLSQVMERAQKKFRVGHDWLPSPVSPSAYGLSPYLIHRSIVQNEVLYSSEGLTLLSLDHLYTFKSALASYASTGSAFRLEDAVDELRRYVLANGRRKLQKSQLLRSYEWLHVNDAALSDVSRMYRRAYGGSEKDSGLENDIDVIIAKPKPMSPRPLPEQSLDSDKEGDITDFENDDDDEDDIEDVTTPIKAVPTPKATPTPTVVPPQSVSPYKTPSPGLKGPALRLQTTFHKPIAKAPEPPKPKVTIGHAINIELHDIARDGEDEDADAELTARPSGNAPGPAFPLFNSFSIDEIMFSPVSALTPHKMGPMTPNDYDDISPTTRGEWGFLTSGDSWKAKTAAVETW